MPSAPILLARLVQLNLRITTVESCTAGLIASLLSEHPNAGSLLESGLVTYSIQAKKDLLGLPQFLFDKYNLTSEPIAKAMALGAIARTQANTLIATTGVLDDTAEPMIPAGTICFCWVYKRQNEKISVFTQTQRFNGTIKERRHQAALYALSQTAAYAESLTDL